MGVAFQNLPSADGISYVIPTPVASHFLSEVQRYGCYRGYCALGISCQTMENPHLRKAVKMPANMTGVMINTVQATASAAQVCRKW